jgi:hypothetical protein
MPLCHRVLSLAAAQPRGSVPNLKVQASGDLRIRPCSRLVPHVPFSLMIASRAWRIVCTIVHPVYKEFCQPNRNLQLACM